MPPSPLPTKGRRFSIGGTKPPWWSKLVRYQGWMLKKGGLTKSWQRRFFELKPVPPLEVDAAAAAVV